MRKNKNNYHYFKRVLDLIIAIIGIIIFLIPMIGIAIAIKIEDGGPILFKQERIGKNGKVFKIYKFRSMHVSNNVLDFKKENRPTKVGILMKKTSLDELPQIFNILKGEMSFIGPRPWIPEYYNHFTNRQKKRQNVLPGLTGLAQAIGRNNISIFDKIEYDLEYISKYSLLMDIKVVLLTIRTLFKKEGKEISKSGIRNEIEDLKFNYLHVTEPILIVNPERYNKVNQ